MNIPIDIVIARAERMTKILVEADANVIRTLLAERAELLKDRDLIDRLEIEARSRGGILLHDGSESGRRGIGLLTRTLRQAIDAATPPKSEENRK